MKNRKDIVEVLDWPTWKLVWESTRARPALNGLLHGIFDIEAEGDDRDERLIFLLRLADGHQVERTRWDDERQRQRNPAWMARTTPLAVRAFKSLCDGFFRIRDEKRFSPEHVDAFSSPRVFPELLRFCHDHDRRPLPHERNLRRSPFGESHHEAVVREFVAGMVKLCWSGDFLAGRDMDQVVAFQANCIAARPLFVDLLHDCGELAILHQAFYEIDDAALEALRRLALEKDGVRVHATTAQAAAAGETGRHLLIIETLREERGRARAKA